MSSLFIDTPFLIFQNHETQNDASLNATEEEIKLLRETAFSYAEITANPVNAQRKAAWRKLNDLEPSRPLIWMNEICWNEMTVGDELTLRTKNPVCQRIETHMLRTIYQWNHMQGDMVVEDVFYSPYILDNTGFQIHVEADVRETDADREIASRHFHNQFQSIDDIEKIKDPVIQVNRKRTEEFYSFYKTVFDGILPVRLNGCTGFWFAPWDDIVFWMNADNVLYNLAAEPDFMHALIKRLVGAYINGMEQFESLGLLFSNNANVRVGSGGYGYTGGLPDADSLQNCTAKQLWGSATPQIFGSVSPQMHEEFGLQYEKIWLERFGLAYYGCCEPLHNKLDILFKIENLRKISISPWANVQSAAEKMKGRYVISLKPSPSILAAPVWKPEVARQELKERLDRAKGCNVEIILKDISTVCREPQRLWEWTRMAQELAENY